MNRLLAAITVLAATTSTTVFADNFTGYWGINYGTVSSHNTDLGNLGIKAGVNVSPVAALEAEYTSSLNDEHVSNGNKLSADTSAVYAKIQSQGDFYINGRIGVARVDFDQTTPLGYDRKNHVSGAAYGVGIGGKLAPNVNLELNYTRLPDLDASPTLSSDDRKNEQVTVGVSLQY